MLIAGGILAYVLLNKQTSQDANGMSSGSGGWGNTSTLFPTTTPAAPDNQTVHEQISNAVVSALGGKEGSIGGYVMHGSHIEGDTIYKSRLRRSATAQEYNLNRAHPSSQIFATGTNPLENAVVRNYSVNTDALAPGQVLRTPMGNLTRGQGVVNYATYTQSARSPANDTERTAARMSNLRDLISRGAYSDTKAKELTAKYGL